MTRADEEVPESDREGDGGGSGISPFKWILVVFPTGLFLLGVVSVVYYLNGGFQEEEIRLRDQREVNVPAMAQMLERLELYAPQRGMETADGREGLRRTLTMFASSLGRRNAGYEVAKTKGVALGGELWPVHLVEIPPRESERGYTLVLLRGTDAFPTIASTIASLEAMASNREAPRGLVVALLPLGSGSGKDAELRELVVDWLDQRELSQVVFCEELGQGSGLSYSGKVGAEFELPVGLDEKPSGQERFGAWKGWFEELPRLVVFTEAGGTPNDAVAQAEQAGRLERMLRRFTGL